jgi:TolB protein
MKAGKDTRITQDDAMELTPDWSPDGKSIAFARNQGNKWSIWSFDLASGASKRMTPYFKQALYPRWSPDGRSLAFSAIESTEWQVFMARVGDSVHATAITDEAWVSMNPTWAPDGRQIGFQSDGGRGLFSQIFVVAIDGGTPHQVTHYKQSSASAPDWGSGDSTSSP